MTVLKQLKVVFEELEDPRIERTKKHPFLSIIFIALCSAMAGIDEWVGMHDYCEANLKFFKKYIALPEGVPSHDTIGRVLARIDIQQFHTCFASFTKQLASKAKGVIAIDGKTMRGSGNRNGNQSPLHAVSAWSTVNSLVLGQIGVETKSNEITAIPKLLEMLDIEGQIITIDAMGCQRKIASQIVENKGDYILALKGNQSSLHEDIKLLFDDLKKDNWGQFKGDVFEEYDKGHGRIEKRQVWATEELGILTKIHDWPGLKSVAMVRGTKTSSDKKSEETRLYISSLKADAKQLGSCIRSHWEVENKLHWILDMTFNEDKSQIYKDNGPANMGVARKWALNILNQHKGKLSMRRMQNKIRMSVKHLSEVLKLKI